MMEPWQKERDTRRSSRRRPSGCWPSRAARIRRRPRRSNRSPRIWGRAGDAAPLAQQDGRHGRGGDQADMARFHVRTPCFLVYAHLPLRWIISAHEGNTMTTSSSLCYRKNYPHIRREMLPRILLIPMPHVYRYAA